MGSGFRLFDIRKLVCVVALIDVNLNSNILIEWKSMNLFGYCLKLQILNKFGSRAPFVVSTVNGILGRDALTREIIEVPLPPPSLFITESLTLH